MAKNKKTRKRAPQKKAAIIMRLIGIRDKSKEYLGHIKDIHSKSVETAQIINTKLQIMTLSFLNPETRADIVSKLGLTEVLGNVTVENKKNLARELYKTIVLMTQLRKASDKLLTDEMARLNTIVNETIPPLLRMTAKEIPVLTVEEIGMQVMDSKMSLDKYSMHSQFIFSFAKILSDVAETFKAKGVTFLDETIKAHSTMIKQEEMQDKLVSWMGQEGLDDFFAFCEPYEEEFRAALHEEEKKMMEDEEKARAETEAEEETDVSEEKPAEEKSVEEVPADTPTNEVENGTN